MKLTPSVLLGLVLLAAPAAVQAQFTYTNADGSIYDYSANADGVSLAITGYTGPPWAVTIPTNINGLIVTSIGVEAFLTNESLTSATIPDSVTSIGGAAFWGCTNLANVTIPASVTNIGSAPFGDCINLASVTVPGSVGYDSIGYWNDVFAGCPNLSSITVSGDVPSIADYAFQQLQNLTNVTISDGVTNIGEGAFFLCPDLASVTMPDSLTSIGVIAFMYCASLTHVTIPDGVTSIGNYAFALTGLTNVTIPASVTNLGEMAQGLGAFFNATNLTAITVDSQNAFFSSAHGVLFDKSQGTLLYCPSAPTGSYTVPSSVTNIEDYAFDFCTILTSVFFQGNAPTADSTAFISDPNTTVYYLPGTTGWSNTFAGVPAVLWNPRPQASGANFSVFSNQFGFNIANGSTNSIPIVVETCANLADPVWTPLQTLILTNGSGYFSEPLQTNSPGRFYRISSP